MLERKDNNASQEELFHHQSHSPQSEVIQKANMFAAVWINKFAHAQTHRESITESLKNLANDSKESVHWEPVLNNNRFSIPIPTYNSVQIGNSQRMLNMLWQRAVNTKGYVRWPWELNTLQLKKTHASGQNTSKVRKHLHQFHNTTHACVLQLQCVELSGPPYNCLALTIWSSLMTTTQLKLP